MLPAIEHLRKAMSPPADIRYRMSRDELQEE